MIRLRVPGSLAYRNLALRVVTSACRMALGRDAEQEGGDFEVQTVSAFGEAFNNIAIHGYADRTPGSIDLEISWNTEAIVIQMTDTGLSFDPATIEPPELDELPEGGMGLFIMRSFMDEVDYQAGPPNVLRLIKRRGAEDEDRPRDETPPHSSDSSRPPENAAGDRASDTWINDTAARLAGGAGGT